jgi:agmatinase
MFLHSNFLGIPPEESTLEKSKALILPVPYERTVSYGVGTKNGPGAILEASHYVELYDDELDEEVWRIGVHTLPAWLPDDMEPAACVAGLEELVAGLLRPGRFVLTLGGEHSIAPGPIRAHHKKHPEMSVLHFDAHGDLRDEYEGQKNSHACAAHRWVELASRRSTSASARSRRRRSTTSARAAR